MTDEPLPLNSSNAPHDTTHGQHRLVFVEHLERLPHGTALWQHDDSVSARQAQRIAALRAAITDALTPKQREAVQLFFFDGLSQGDIARRLNISQQVVHKRLFGTRRKGRVVGGAINKLRKALGAPQPCETPTTNDSVSA